MEHVVVITTCPNAPCADEIAAHLVQEGLAACVTRLPGVRSTYVWEGEVRSDDEILLLIKTRAEVYGEIEAAIRTRHPYTVPEIIAVPVERGSVEYLTWINNLVEKKS